jgi:hypothetical protein
LERQFELSKNPNNQSKFSSSSSDSDGEDDQDDEEAVTDRTESDINHDEE